MSVHRYKTKLQLIKEAALLYYNRVSFFRTDRINKGEESTLDPIDTVQEAEAFFSGAFNPIDSSVELIKRQNTPLGRLEENTEAKPTTPTPF